MFLQVVANQQESAKNHKFMCVYPSKPQNIVLNLVEYTDRFCHFMEVAAHRGVAVS